MSQSQAIGDVSNDSGYQEHPTGAHEFSGKVAARNDHEEEVTVFQQSEGRPSIVEVCQIEKSGNHSNGTLKRNRTLNQELGSLIKDDKEKNAYTCCDQAHNQG